ncbi:MAG: CopG family transcriptional regulator [Sulfuricellaceae bacterium]
MIETLIIRQGIQRRFHQLAEETHRTESEIINEALVGYLVSDQRYTEVLRQRVAAADRGEFAGESEVEAFFRYYVATAQSQ